MMKNTEVMDLETARISRLTNWTLVDNMKEYYRYVVAAKVAYEIIVVRRELGKSYMEAIGSGYLTGEWIQPDGTFVFLREEIVHGTVKECINAIIKDYKENIAND